MSVKVMSHIWEHSKQEGGALLVLLALADFANDEGRAFPSVPTLAKKARLTVRHTQRVLQDLEKAGEITTDPQAGPHGCNVYRVNLSPRQNVTPDICDKRGVTSDTGGVTPVSPDPSVEPSKKPSVGSRASAPSPDSLISDLQSNPAYEGVDVRREFYKMQAWCQAHSKEPTRRRFVNWLNRVDVVTVPRGSPPAKTAAAPDEQKRLEEKYRARRPNA